MQFNAIIEHDQDGFSAYIPDLKGCVSQGDTLEETLSNIKEALGLYTNGLSGGEKIDRQAESFGKVFRLIVWVANFI